VVPCKPNLTPAAQKEEQERRLCYLQFLMGVLQLNPELRWTPRQALQHSFVNPEAPYDANFQPPKDLTAPAGWAPLSPLPVGPGPWSGSGCPSAGSSASSAASTPSAACSGRRGGRGRSGWPGGPANGRRTQSSTTNTPASSPHGSLPSTAVSMCAGQYGAYAQNCTGRNSSPWHLPSPMSEQSTVTASERIPSSHYSGSDSCGELVSRGSMSQNDASSGWPRSAQQSDSDGASVEDRAAAAKEPQQQKLWKNIRSVTRAELSRHLPHRLDPAHSPGVAGNVGNFREAVGMSKSGPVVPFGPGVRRGANAAGPHSLGGGVADDTHEIAGSGQNSGGGPPPQRMTSSGSLETTPMGGWESGNRSHRFRGRRRTG